MPAGDDPCRRARPAPDPAGGLRAPGARGDGGPRPGDARLPGRAARSSSTTATTSGPRRQQAGVANAFDFAGFVPALHPAPVLRGPRAVPLGRPLRRPGRHPAHGRRDPAPLPGRRRAAALDRDGPGEGARSRGSRRGSAGWATASGRRPGWPSTSSSGAGEVSAPIVIGRDHLDSGSVASPNRETEAMADGTDAVADWPLLNALVNTAAGATWVSIHHGGGVGIGYSQHAGMVVVADGTDLAAQKLERVLTSDPGMGVIRHADAGYERALESPGSAASGSRCGTGAADGSAAAVELTARPARRRPVGCDGSSSTGAGISRIPRTGLKRTGRTASHLAQRPDEDGLPHAEHRAQHAAEHAPDRDRAPDEPAHRGVHPALHPGRRDRLAQADLGHVVDDRRHAGRRTRTGRSGRPGPAAASRPGRAPAGGAPGRADPREDDDRRGPRPAGSETRLATQRAEERARRPDREREADRRRRHAQLADGEDEEHRVATLPNRFAVAVQAAMFFR